MNSKQSHGVKNVSEHEPDLKSDQKSENVKPPVTFDEFLAINSLVRTEENEV